jgi:hypothetical protein
LGEIIFFSKSETTKRLFRLHYLDHLCQISSFLLTPLGLLFQRFEVTPAYIFYFFLVLPLGFCFFNPLLLLY